MNRGLACMLGALGLALAACGERSEDRFDLRTPGAHTGKGVVAPTATPTPKPVGPPVSKTEVAVIRGWSDALRHGHVAAAARYFTIPSKVGNATAAQRLASRDDIRDFNRALPCGAKLEKTRRSTVKGFVIGTFLLTERPGGRCSTGLGHHAEVAFLIRHRRINQWLQLPDPPEEPAKPSGVA